MCDPGKKCKSGIMSKELILLCVLLVYSPVESKKNLLETIRGRADLSEAAAIIEKDIGFFSTPLTSDPFTAFIPTNAAFKAYTGPRNKRLIQYHLVNLPLKLEDLQEEQSTTLPGNARLYVAKIPSGQPVFKGYEDNYFYINNAKVVEGNIECIADIGLPQWLHIVDQVIAPSYPQTASNITIGFEYMYPDAQKLLLKPQYYGLEGNFSVSEFQKRVSNLKAMDSFNITGRNTFFIPVDQALNVNTDSQDVIDKQVIDGHIIPGKVLFTRTVQSPTEQYQSMAFADNLKVYLSMENVSSPGNDGMIYYVKSNTVAGDVAHKKGTVLARIPRGNIPVKNGVVHLIDRPLMVIASSIISFLSDKEGQLTKFYDIINKHYPDLTHPLTVGQDLTLFAPSNEAFKMVNEERLERVLLNKEKLEKLLKLHMVQGSLTTDEIARNAATEIFQRDTLSPRRKLYFAVDDPEAFVPVVSLEGGGVNATITTPNVAAKNGVIHIIDRILGIPSQTVYDKLKTDPMLSTTFALSEQDGWNQRLAGRDERFTLFVPSNDAWKYINRAMASAYKKLFMGKFAYHGRMILERHMIAGQDLTLEELTMLTTNSTKPGLLQKRLDMTRGKIYFQARIRDAYGEYFVEWKGVTARVIRPDVECVNGVVHVIDQVLMAQQDVTVSGSTYHAATGVATLTATFITVAFARALHR